MPKESINKSEKHWLEWVVRLCYGPPVQNLSPVEQAAQLKKLYEFCTPPTPRRGALLTILFRYVAPNKKTPPLPTLDQLARFQEEERLTIDKKFKGEEIGQERIQSALAASRNISPSVLSFTSEDPVFTAMTTFGVLLAKHWEYVRRCPRWKYESEKCDRVFVSKKSTGLYCSNRCRMRVQNREENNVQADRYGVSGPKPKRKGVKAHGTKR